MSIIKRKEVPERVTLGSGHLFYQEFEDGNEVPSVDDLCIDDNILGYIQGGATLTYKPEYYTASDDDGTHQKTIITSEEAILKSGIMTFNGKTLNTLCDTARITEDVNTHRRIVKIGGLKNMKRKKYVLCFRHEDTVDGNIYVLIVGSNQSGFELAFAKDKESVIDAEFKALPHDNEGTLIRYIEDDKSIKEETTDNQSGDEGQSAE